MTLRTAWRAIRDFWPALVAAAALGWAKWQRHQGVRQGKAEERGAQKVRDLTEYQGTRRRVDDAIADPGPSDRAEWLKEYAKRNGG
jgi:hypothetical protein